MIQIQCKQSFVDKSSFGNFNRNFKKALNRMLNEFIENSTMLTENKNLGPRKKGQNIICHIICYLLWNNLSFTKFAAKIKGPFCKHKKSN